MSTSRSCGVQRRATPAAPPHGARSGSPPNGCPELRAVHPGASTRAGRAARRRAPRASWTRDEAIVELLRGRLTIIGPITAAALAASARRSTERDVDAALLALEGRGRRPARAASRRGARATDALEWCDRSLLARIHRYTLNRLRAEIEPVSRPTSCASCSLAARRAGDAARRDSTGCARSSRSSTASSCRRAHGSARSCRRASTATSRRCSTCCA